MAFKPLKTASKHKVQDGDTLKSIAAKAGVTVEQLGLFNWGTAKPKEMARAMVEVVGARPGPDGKVRFSSSDATRGTGEVALPEKFAKEGLATATAHTLTVRRERPMPAVSIQTLDKWFVPGEVGKDGEICSIAYSLEGIKERADKVMLEVHASNYCSSTVDAKGKVSYTPISGPLPLYKEEMKAEASDPEDDETHEVRSWSGQCTVGSGMLKAEGDDKRYVNVAFSPYTVLLRLYKSGGDKEATLLLSDFWPRWDEKTGALQADSLTVKWEVKKTSKLKHGQLIVVNREDKPVFRTALKAADLGEGEHQYAWDGALADGTKVKAADMPYRVQIQAHTDMDEDTGLALAAMHTEVRLFVHKETGKNKPEEAYKDPSSLRLTLAPWTPKEPAEGDGDKWVQFKMAEAGYHPGPVTGSIGAHSKKALEELQRSLPGNAAAPYARLSVTGAVDADTKAAVGRLSRDQRPIFGEPSAGAAPTAMSRLSAAGRLKENLHSDGVAIWVDDRNAYTEPNPGRPYLGSKMFMDDYHGGMSIGDGKVAKDKDAIPRPWIPLMVDLPLLSRDGAKSGLQSDDTVLNRASQGALGPLRVDWAVEELPPDESAVDTGHSGYQPDRTRSRKWISEAQKGKEATSEGKKYPNCPQSHGGIRPADLTTYAKVAFGHGDDDKLEPWVAEFDSATKAVCTIVHDAVGQPKDKLYATHRGRAGVYFHPSRIAGDGYRVQARVSFDKLPSPLSDFPNLKVLKKRYPKLPGAHSSPLRIWRRTSYRGYIAWCPPGDSHWPGHRTPCADYYRGAFLHFIDEPGPSAGASYVYNLAGIVSQAEYSRAVTANVTDAQYATLTITLDLQHVWPYCGEPHFGIPQGGPGTDINNFYNRVLNPMFSATWRRYRKDLLHLLLKKVEDNIGRFRGHLLVEFKSSPELWVEEYQCSDPGCPAKRAEVITGCTSAAQLLLNSPCPTGAAGHTMVRCTPRRGRRYSSIPLPAVGVSMGATWLFTTGGPDVWAHELGHHRHLEHAQANPGSTGSATNHPLGRSVKVAGVWHRCGAAPGAKADQHDTVVNPNIVGVAANDPIHPDKDRCWDRNCVMSYTHGEPLFFCGKCLMKNRGWKVEDLPNPAGNVKD